MKLLKKYGMTQRVLADKVGVTEVSMTRYIHGERTPSAKVLQKLAYELHTTPEYILDIETLEPLNIAFARLLRDIEKYRSQLDMNQKIEIISTLLTEPEEDKNNQIKTELAEINAQMFQLQQQKERLDKLLESI